MKNLKKALSIGLSSAILCSSLVFNMSTASATEPFVRADELSEYQITEFETTGVLNDFDGISENIISQGSLVGINSSVVTPQYTEYKTEVEGMVTHSTFDALDEAADVSLGGSASDATVNNGVATFTLNGTGDNKIYIASDEVFSTETNGISFHIDASAFTGNIGVRLWLNKNSDHMAWFGNTYYFLPDATNENPNPELEKKTIAGSGQWQTWFYIVPGSVGTYYFPNSAFDIPSSIDVSSLGASYQKELSVEYGNNLNFQLQCQPRSDSDSGKQLKVSALNWTKAGEWECNTNFEEIGFADNLSLKVTSANIFKTSFGFGKNYGNAPTADAKYIAVDIDTTGIAKDVSKRVRLVLSNGSGLTYAVSNKPYYYVNDGDDTVYTATTYNNSGGSIWDTFAYIYGGYKRTYYFPIDIFVYDCDSTEYNYTLFGTSVSNDTESGELINPQTMSQWSAGSFALEIRTALAVDEVITFDNVEWVKDYDLGDYIDAGYDYYTPAQDFEDFEINSTNVPSIYGNNGLDLSTNTVTSGTGWINRTNLSSADGILTMDFNGYGSYTNADGETVSPRYIVNGSSSRMSMHLQLNKSITSDYSAFTFDIDTTNVKRSDDARVYLRFNYVIDGVSYQATNGDVYLVSSNGEVSVYTITGNSDNSKMSLPCGFKGKVIVPVSIMKCTSDYKYTDAIYNDGDVARVQIRISDCRADDYTNGNTISFDNIGYLRSLAPENEGTLFTRDNIGGDYAEVEFKEDVYSIETWVKIPRTTVNATIIGTKYLGETTASQFQLAVEDGKPYVYLRDTDGNTVSFTADTNINNEKWHHLALVRDEGAKQIKLYINGTVAKSADYESLTSIISHADVTVGLNTDSRANYSKNLNGYIYDMRVWDKTISQEEIINNMFALNDTAEPVAHWLFIDSLTDVAGNGYDLEVENNFVTGSGSSNNYGLTMNDGDYTMIVVGDTQSLNNKYNKYASSRKNADGEDYFTGLYSWIVKNQEALNIQMVLGLGDIVEDRAKDTNEWLAAVDNFNMLKVNNVPFVTIMGDHDTVNIGVRETDLYNSYFSQSYFEDVAEVSGLVGFYEEDHSENAYYVKKIGDIEYLIFGIECEPRKSVVSWMDEIIAENQDKRVIITTHKYLSINGELGTSYYNTSEENALPQYVWDNLLDKYSNIDMILGGHYSYADVVTRKTTNSKGTDVYQMLFDPQEIDNDGNPAGAVGILKFSADGNTVDVRWYSTVEDMLIGEDNQTTITLNAQTEKELIGDITADGVVNAEDLSSLRKKLMTNNEYDALYDVNKDDHFNLKDLVALKKIAAFK